MLIAYVISEDTSLLFTHTHTHTHTQRALKRVLNKMEETKTLTSNLTEYHNQIAVGADWLESAENHADLCLQFSFYGIKQVETAGIIQKSLQIVSKTK